MGMVATMLATSSASTMPGTAPVVGRHRLSPAALDEARQLLAFNWLPAAYAHRDWLGPWAELLEPRDRAGMSLLCRASLVLLDRHGLRQRHLRSAASHPWLLHTNETLAPIAQELGIAMLGGWVRGALEREQVALQLRVLGPRGRERALKHAATLKALPHIGTTLDVAPYLSDTASVADLGFSAMAELLDDETLNARGTGAKQRFMLRFARGQIVALPLTPPQRVEALALIAQMQQPQGGAA